MAPKKDKRSHPRHDSNAEKYGLRVTPRDPKMGLVGSAICRFCESFGREEVDRSADTATATATKRKRERTQNKRHYCKQFRSDNMSRHVLEQHAKKWAEYGEANACKDNNPGYFAKFFTQALMVAFFERRSSVDGGKRHVFIKKSQTCSSRMSSSMKMMRCLETAHWPTLFPYVNLATKMRMLSVKTKLRDTPSQSKRCAV
jgi:hypothetical protein